MVGETHLEPYPSGIKRYESFRSSCASSLTRRKNFGSCHRVRAASYRTFPRSTVRPVCASPCLWVGRPATDEGTSATLRSAYRLSS